MLIKGTDLNARQIAIVKAAFVHRWTHENARQSYHGQCPACAQAGPFPYVCGEALPDGPRVYTQEQWHAYHKPLTSDAEWLAAHAFHFVKNGTRLMASREHAEPAYQAD